MPKSYSTGMIVLLLLCSMYIVIYPQFAKQERAAEEDAYESEETIVDSFDEEEQTIVDSFDEDPQSTNVRAYYEFKSAEQLESHYEKHGMEMGFESESDYLDAANNLINNPDALHKNEKEDGDDIYYLEATNEIAFVSTSGYLRTYFICSGKDYFDRQ